MVILAPKKDRRTGMLLAFVTAFVVTLYPVFSGAAPWDFDYSGDPENDDPSIGGCVYKHVDNEFPGWALNCTEGPPLFDQAVFPDRCLDDLNLEETLRADGGVSACSGDYEKKIISCEEFCGQRKMFLKGRCVPDNRSCLHPIFPFGKSVATSKCQCAEVYEFAAGDNGVDPFQPGWTLFWENAFACFKKDPSYVVTDMCWSGSGGSEVKLLELTSPTGCFQDDNTHNITEYSCKEECKKKGFNQGSCVEVTMQFYVDTGFKKKYEFIPVGYCQCQDNNGNPVPPEMIPPEGTSSPRPPAADNSISMEKFESTLCSTSGFGDPGCPSSPAADPSLDAVYDEIEQIS